MANEDKVPRLYVKGADGEFHEVMLGDVTVEEIQGDDEMQFSMVNPTTVIATGWIVLWTMKIAGLIDIAWGWVMCPVWLPVLSALVLHVILFVWSVLAGFADGWSEERNK